MSESPHDPLLISCTTSIVAGLIAQGLVQASGVNEVIASTYGALAALGQPAPPVVVPEPAPTPAVPVKKSVTDDYLISLIDGRRYKSLKRHLSGHGLTPATYRERYGLPADYPMTAPSYAKRRSELAKNMGLGRRPTPEPAPAPRTRAARVPEAA